MKKKIIKFAHWVVLSIKRSSTLWALLLGIFLIGVILNMGSHWLAEARGPESFWVTLLRDLGLACWISVLIAMTIEIGLARRIATGGLEAMMKAIIPEDVWGEIRRHIVGQAVIRENYGITMTIDDGVLANGCYVSSTTLLYSLRSTEDANEYMVEHELDNHRTAQDSQGNLPRYESAMVGSKLYTGNDLTAMLTNNGFGVELPVEFRKAGEAVSVALAFKEVVRLPDTFNWWMPVTTRQPSFSVARIPMNMAFEVKANHPRPYLLKERIPGKHWHFDGIMLPGQAFEIRSSIVEKGGNNMAGGKG